MMVVYQPPSKDGEHIATLPFTRWLQSKNPTDVLKALQGIVAGINAIHVEKAVFRVHSDRGGEFDSKLLR